MTDLPFFVELNEQNLTEILQQSLRKTTCSSIFTRQQHKESADFFGTT